jgi:3-hydroxyacyl-CoA dehydrogenase
MKKKFSSTKYEGEGKMGIGKIACVGAGLIGHSWATLFAVKGLSVNLQDLKEENIARAVTKINSNVKFLAVKGVIKKGEAEAAIKRIKTTKSLSEAVMDADYVQESVFESYEVKKKIFSQMDAEAPPEAILASSSSALLMSEIQEATTKPGRCLIAHPFNPPHLIPLVELVPGKKTSSVTIKTAYEFMVKMGKVPVVLKKEVPGYIANRLSRRLYEEAVDLVDDGVATVEDVDRALSAGPGIRWTIMGPHLTYHLGGGPGGIEHWFEVFGRYYDFRPSAVKKVIKGVKEMEIVKKKSMEELVRWRDEKLVELLKIIYDIGGIYK